MSTNVSSYGGGVVGGDGANRTWSGTFANSENGIGGDPEAFAEKNELPAAGRIRDIHTCSCYTHKSDSHNVHEDNPHYHPELEPTAGITSGGDFWGEPRSRSNSTGKEKQENNESLSANDLMAMAHNNNRGRSDSQSTTEGHRNGNQRNESENMTFYNNQVPSGDEDVSHEKMHCAQKYHDDVNDSNTALEDNILDSTYGKPTYEIRPVGFPSNAVSTDGLRNHTNSIRNEKPTYEIRAVGFPSNDALSNHTDSIRNENAHNCRCYTHKSDSHNVHEDNAHYHPELEPVAGITSGGGDHSGEPRSRSNSTGKENKNLSSNDIERNYRDRRDSLSTEGHRNGNQKNESENMAFYDNHVPSGDEDVSHERMHYPQKYHDVNDSKSASKENIKLNSTYGKPIYETLAAGLPSTAVSRDELRNHSNSIRKENELRSPSNSVGEVKNVHNCRCYTHKSDSHNVHEDMPNYRPQLEPTAGIVSADLWDESKNPSESFGKEAKNVSNCRCYTHKSDSHNLHEDKPNYQPQLEPTAGIVSADPWNESRSPSSNSFGQEVENVSNCRCYTHKSDSHDLLEDIPHYQPELEPAAGITSGGDFWGQSRNPSESFGKEAKNVNNCRCYTHKSDSHNLHEDKPGYQPKLEPVAGTVSADPLNESRSPSNSFGKEVENVSNCRCYTHKSSSHNLHEDKPGYQPELEPVAGRPSADFKEIEPRSRSNSIDKKTKSSSSNDTTWGKNIPQSQNNPKNGNVRNRNSSKDRKNHKTKTDGKKVSSTDENFSHKKTHRSEDLSDSNAVLQDGKILVDETLQDKRHIAKNNHQVTKLQK